MADLEKLDREAPVGAFSTYDAEILIAQLEKLEPGQLYLEVGVDKGKSLWISKQVVKEGVEVHGVDLREDPGVTGAVFHRGDSVAIAKDWEKKIDVLFIDGDHSYEGVKKDWEMYGPLVREGGIIAFHDALYHADKTEEVDVLWKELKYNHINCREIKSCPNSTGIGVIIK